MRFSLLFSMLVLFSCKTLPAEQGKNKQPNIIYIMADDLGYGDLGAFGQSKIKTPHLDKMAQQGMIFTQHYAGSTVCGPSRTVLMTGLHTGHAPVRGNPRWTATGKAVDIPAEEILVAEELKQAGYATAVIGKWGLAEAGMESMPLNQGFDYFYGFKTHRAAHHYYPEELWENNTAFPLPNNNIQDKKGEYMHDTFAEKAIDFIEQQKKNPFFLYLAFTIPHYELTVPEESKAPYLNLGWEERKMKQGHYRHDEEGHTTYAGMVSRMDRDIGTILKTLDKLGLTKNTLVVFTSDNGHEFDRNFFNSNGPLKGKKRDLYEGGIRVPTIAYWPGTVPAQSKTEHISAFWDFYPTACELAGVQAQKKIDGISYVPTLKGQTNNQQKHDFLYWEFNEKQGPIQAIRKGKWKAVQFLGKPMELYDLSKDLGETENLAHKQAEIVEQMQALFLSARTENANFPLEPHARLRK